MKIGFIGTGIVARSVARSALDHGHEAVLGSRRSRQDLDAAVTRLTEAGASIGSVRDAATCDIVVLAVPWLEIADALQDVPSWNDRILVDATNPFIAFDPKLELADLGGRSSSRIVAGHAPGARVVKALNSVTMANFDKGPRHGDARRILFVSGDQTDAKAIVAELIESFGYAVIDLGDLDRGGLIQQAGGPLAGKDLLLAA